MSGIDSFTAVCMHFDGTNGSTTFTDSSQYGRNFAVYGGTPSLTTAHAKFGSASLDTTSTGSILGPTTGALALGNGNFVTDFWWSPTGDSTECLVDWGFNTLGTNAPSILQLNAGGGISWYVNGSARITGGTVTINTGVFTHVAVVRSGTTTRLFFNGVQTGSDFTSDSINYAVDTTAGGPCIGSAVGHGSAQLGYYDEFRISIGTDRGWFNGFTPPTSAYSAGVLLQNSKGLRFT